MKKKRRIKRVIRNGLIYLMLILSIVLFVLSSFQLSVTNPLGMLVLVVSGSYIIAFWSVNCDE